MPGGRGYWSLIQSVRAWFVRSHRPAPAKAALCCSDWTWRPTLWSSAATAANLTDISTKTSLCPAVTLFHDGLATAVSLKQLPLPLSRTGANFETQIDVGAFEGTFLSLVLDLPAPLARSTTRDHILSVNGAITMTAPITCFVRLNIRHGPNTETLSRGIDLRTPNFEAAFDLAYSKIDDKRITQTWIDLIFEAPAMAQIALRNIQVRQHRRAQL